MAKKQGIRLIANNKKAFHDYFIEDTFETGISLAGTEVKSLRMSKCSIKRGFVRIEKAGVCIYGMHISPTKREIFLTRILFITKSFCFTDMRSINWKVN